MSSLEERREARRRRRQAEDDLVGTLSKSEISDLVDARLQQRRVERQRRRAEAAASINGGEDDLERRRRERREARLRGDSAPAEEEAPRRSRRNRGGDDETASEDTTSTRSRRRRGGDDEEPAPAPAPAPVVEEKQEEPAAPAAEEDDSAAREAEEAERRRQQEEEEERRRQQEEERRRQQEELRRREEERREEERKRKTRRETPAEHSARSVRISTASPSGIRSPGLRSPTDHGHFGQGSARHSARSTGLPNTGRSLSDCIFNYTSDDAISDLAMENERLLEMSSDCDLGSSFDEFVFSDHEKKLVGGGVGGAAAAAAAPKRHRARVRGVSPLAAAPGESLQEGGRQQGARRVPDVESAERASPAVDNSFASSHDEEDDFVPFSRERPGATVEGDLASRARKRPGDISENSFDEADTASAPKARNGGVTPVSSSLLPRRDSEGFDCEATAPEARKTSDRSEERKPKRVTPFAYLSSGCESPVSDRDDISADTSVTPRTPTERTPAASSQNQQNRPDVSSGNARSFLPGHHRCVSSPVDAAPVSQPGHQRSASSPAQTWAGRHQDISTRMSELQKQLQGRRADPSQSTMRRMRSQGDLSPSSSIRSRSKINDLIGQLSDRLKKRDGSHDADNADDSQESFSAYQSQRERDPQHDEESFSLYRCQSEPLVASMATDKLAESPRVPPSHGDIRHPDSDSLMEEGEESFTEDCDTNDAPVAEHDSIYLEECSSDTGRKKTASAQHDGKKADNPPLHATPTSVTRPRSGLPNSRGGRPDKIKEELRLCLDFLDDPAEDLDSEEEQEEAQQEPVVQQVQNVVQSDDVRLLDTSSCSSNYDMSPAPEYSETDDFAEDEASYAQGVSAYFSEDSFSQAHAPAFDSAWDRDRAASMPDITDKENVPFMKRLLQSAMARPTSPPLPPPPVAAQPSFTPPPAVSATPPITPPPPVSTTPRSPPPLPAVPPPPMLPSSLRSPPATSPRSLQFPPPMSPRSPESPGARRQLQPPCLPPPPPPPPPTPATKDAVTSFHALGRKPGAGQARAPVPRVDRKADVDLHSLLCAEIVELGQRRSKTGVQTDVSSLDPSKRPAENESDSAEHLLRPSALLTGQGLRDWGPPSKSFASRLQASEPVISSYEILTPKRVTNPNPAVVPAQETEAPDLPEGTSLVSFWKKREEENLTEKEPLSWRQSLAARFKPFEKSKSAVEFRSTPLATTTTEQKETLISTLQNVASHRGKPAKPEETVMMTEESLTEKRSVVTSTTVKPMASAQPSDFPDSGVKTAAENVTRKIPPPTLPKSASTTNLQLPRTFLAEKPPTAQVFAQNSHSRLSSTSSLESEVFTPKRPPTGMEAQQLGQRGPEGRHVSVEDDGGAGGSVGQESETSFHFQRRLSQNLLMLQKENTDTADVDKPISIGRRLSNKLYTETQNDADVPCTVEIGTAAPQSDSESDAPKRRSAPRPRFNARRLTQELNIPVVWKCSEEAKTEYVPKPLSATSYSFTKPETPVLVDPGAEIPSCNERTVPEKHKSDYRSWAADFLKDRISVTGESGNNTARDTSDHAAASGGIPSSASVDTGADVRASSLSARTPPPVRSRPMSISERIGLLNKAQSPKTSTSSAPDFKPGSITDREGPDDTPRVKSRQTVPTKEQKKFASLLQNRLVNIIAEDDEDRKREKAAVKEKAKKAPAQRLKLTPAQEIARSRAIAGNSKKAFKTELPPWSPDLTSTPAPLSRSATDSQLLTRQKTGSVMDMAKEFDHLSDSISKEEEERRRSNVKRRPRRLSTGLSVREMKDMFDNPDSLPSSCNSTRANSPKPVSAISEKVFERFGTPTIAENRPVVEKDMVLVSRLGSRNSVLDIVNKVETGAAVTPTQRTSVENGRAVSAATTAKPSASLARAGAVTADNGAPARKGKMDRSRRYTTGVNFAELQLRFSEPEGFKKTNQSRAMSTIYASSRDISRQYELSPKSSARSMENLTAREAPLGIFRAAKSRFEASAENLLDISRDSAFDRPLTRAESYGCALDSPHPNPRDIQSTNGSAFSRVSAIRSPIKVTEPDLPAPPAASFRDSPVGEDTPALPARHTGETPEEEERMEAERAEQERKQKEEEERRKEEEEKKKKKKRKGLGGLSPEKKKLLKKLIMQKAAEDLRNEAKAKAEEKERFINERVTPLKLDGLGQAELQKLVKELHSKVATLEEEVYDWEIKIRKQDFEINELTLKVNDTKGKFIKPVLRKVNKTESKLTKLQTKESRDFRGNLKSTGQSKFALKDEDDSAKQPDWREALKHGAEEGGEEAATAAAES